MMSISTGTTRADGIQTAGFACVWIRKDNIKIDDTNAFIHGSHTGPYVGIIYFQLMVTIKKNEHWCSESVVIIII